MPARSHVRIVRRHTPEWEAGESTARAQACFDAYASYAWRWMIDAEGALGRGEKVHEPLLDFLDYLREQVPDDQL